MENIGLVTAILQKDADTPKEPTRGLMVDAQDKFGDTALHVAGRHGNKPIAKQLLNFKANDNVLNEASLVIVVHFFSFFSFLFISFLFSYLGVVLPCI